MIQLLQHPLSAAWPAMQADEFQALKDSIEIIGVQNPITLLDGMVIDGWHRYCAAKEVGMDCPSKLLGDVDPVDFVKSQNDARRNVTASQRALAITTIYSWRPVGKPVSNSTPGVELGKTTAELAVIAGVHANTITQAKAVQANATPEVKAAVKAGTMSVKKAAETTKPAKPAPVVEPEAEIPEQESELDAVKEALSILNEENDRLNDQLAIAQLDATDEEKSAAHTTILALRAENKTLTATNRALILSRDSLMEDVVQLKRQCQMQRKEIDKLKNSKQ